MRIIILYLWPGEDGVVGAESHQEEDEGEGNDHASPVRVAHQLNPDHFNWNHDFEGCDDADDDDLVTEG